MVRFDLTATDRVTGERVREEALPLDGDADITEPRFQRLNVDLRRPSIFISRLLRPVLHRDPRRSREPAPRDIAVVVQRCLQPPLRHRREVRVCGVGRMIAVDVFITLELTAWIRYDEVHLHLRRDVFAAATVTRSP